MIQITVCDMRAAGKPGYVAKLNGKEKSFLTAKSYDGYGSSAKNIHFEISEDAYGIYEICDANYGGRKRNFSYVAVALHGWEEFESLNDAEAFILKVETPKEVEIPKGYPGLKSVAQQEAAEEEFDVAVKTIKRGDEKRLAVQMLSDDAFKLFMPEMKHRIPGREWNPQSRYWSIPAESIMLLREMIEERTIRTNNMRKALKFQITDKAKYLMAMD